MIQIYKSKSDTQKLVSLSNLEPGCWINLIAPTEEELLLISKKTNVPMDFLKSALDDEETSRIDIEDDISLFIIDIPYTDMEENALTYDTYPLGIIHTPNEIITVCLKNSKIIRDFTSNEIKSFNTSKKSTLTLKILHRIYTYYLIYLRQIDKKSILIEEELYESMRNRELSLLHSLKKSLVYFSTALKSSKVTLLKISKLEFMIKYENDEDLLEDVMIEHQQATEMTNIYSNILSSTISFSASIISNNFNNVAKFLTSMTTILSLFTISTGIYGMNIPLPMEHYPHAFAVLMTITSSVAAISLYLLNKNGMLK